MVFHGIAVWLFVLAIPLWAYRWYLFALLVPRERLMFRRLIKQRYENAIVFCLRVFGFLIAVSIAVMIIVFGLGFLKQGTLRIGSFREMIRSRLYSGVETVDKALDTFHYDQMMPIAALTTVILLSIAFTLVATALRDISVMKRIKKKLQMLLK